MNVFFKLIPLFFLCSAVCLMHSFSAPEEALAAPGLLSISGANRLKQTPDPQTPRETVDGLSARAKDWREPSRESEEKYVEAIRLWLDSLEPFKRERARAILREAHPYLEDLREAIRDKKAQLAALSFDRGTSPETLPRLGMELQKLKASLRDRLKQVTNRLRFEAGVDTGPMQSDSFWLSPVYQ